MLSLEEKIACNKEKIKNLKRENKELLQKQKLEEEKKFKDYQKKLLELFSKIFSDFEDEKGKLDLFLLEKYLQETKDFAKEIFESAAYKDESFTLGGCENERENL